MGLIYLDSCVVIYLVERNPKHVARVEAAMAQEAGAQFAISPLVKAECFTGPFRLGDARLERAFTLTFASLLTLPMTEDIFIEAARLRARSMLRTPDALHLACAIRHGCTGLWTNDARLSAAGGSLVKVL